MKKILVILLAAGTLAACGTRPEATVEGTVTGVADGTAVYIIDSKQVRTDSTVVAGGKFRFEMAKAYPDQANLLFSGVSKAIPFFIEPGAITSTVDFKDDGVAALFSGTDTNDRMNTMNEGMNGYLQRMRELTPMLLNLEKEGKGRGTPQYDSLMAIYMENSKGRREYNDNTILENPNTVFAAYIMHRDFYNSNSNEYLDSILNMIAGAPANGFTDRLTERRDALASTTIGQPAPDFTQAQADGTPFSLSSLRGKLVLIDFWASWCGPCRAENPNVVKLYNRFRENGFEIVGVSLDNDRAAWLKAIEDDGLVWRHVSDLGGWGNAVAKQYAVRSVPHTVLVGQDGVIIAKNLRGAALESKVSEVLTGEKIEFPSTVN